MSRTNLIVGLGNNDSSYLLTRHNIGFWFIDSLAKTLKKNFFKSRYGSCTSKILLKNNIQIIIFKPYSYMNNIGKPILNIMNNLKLKSKNIIIVHDDIDLSIGKCKLKNFGNNAGHNGLKSIEKNLMTNSYSRIRIGIGRPFDKQCISDYVLSKPSIKEKFLIHQSINKIIFSLEIITQNFNSNLNCSIN